MCYNGLNNMFFPLCQINDNHSVTSPSHTKKTKSDNYRKHHKSTLIDNKALSLFKMDDHEKVIGLIQKMKRIYDSLPSGKITKETDRKIHKYFIDIASMQIINVTIELREEFTLIKIRKCQLRWYIL